ncbi:MAG: glycosyltransferase family 39 protein [Planctomyces sp.]|nr:glycosyltransferase family 39 protein [Planctomyces sp.]
MSRQDLPPASRASGPAGFRLAGWRMQAAVWGLCTLAVIALEARRWTDPERRTAALEGRLFDGAEDYGPFLPILLAAPIFWAGSRRGAAAPFPDEPPAAPASTSATLVWSVLTAGLAFSASLLFARPFAGMPPAIHDEFSYLFQAQTFLAGRLSFPSFAPLPELFDQVHVLNEGRFASRYFPGTGLWLAPFVALGNPWLGQWTANALIAGMVVWIGRELSGLRTGAIAGLLCAGSPGLIVYSNRLLAHQPTLLALVVFLWAMLRCRRSPSAGWGLLAGTALAFAMLCRPMTAAGVALPWGVEWLIRLERGSADPSAPAGVRPRWSQTLALGAPLVAAGGLMLVCNAAITGSPWRSPYQVYTDTYTPRHTFGFNNVVRGAKRLGPKTLDNYDRWAENLTPKLAARNVGERLISSLRWSLGVIPLGLAAAVVLIDWRRWSRGWRLVIASIVSLHAAHVPYWFAGIEGWHYVFESAPMWLLLFAEAARRMSAVWSWEAPGMRWWGGGLLATALAVNLVSIEPLWRSRVDTARVEAMFARARYAQFRRKAAELAAEGPIIVFVEPDPADRHMDYVTNPPSLDGPVLVARAIPDRTDVDAARRLFPDRRAWLFRPGSWQWIDLDR